MQIKVLQAEQYVEVPESPNFPGLALTQVIPEFLQQSQTIGRNPVMKAFRQWVREQAAS